MKKPFGIHTIHDMIGSADAYTQRGRAVPLPYSGNTLIKLWWVLTGKAEAVIWPKPGDLETALKRGIAKSSIELAKSQKGE